MPNTVVFLWISATAAHPAISPRALIDLRDFGAARGLDFAALEGARSPSNEGRPLGLPANDSALVDSLEAELEQARTALSALEEVSASARLSRVESTLLAHPHLPQASFLMAECLALQAQAARSQDPRRAAQLDARRYALEGPRSAAFGEDALEQPAVPGIWLDVRGPGPTDQLELDGRPATSGVARALLVPGLHHARVWRGGRPVFAKFTEVSDEQTTLVLDVPQLVPCSPEDLERVPRDASESALPLPDGIACERWARVRDQGAGIGVAWCEHSRCGAFVAWQRRKVAPFTPIAVSGPRFPAWTSFVLAGGAALAASSLLLWQSGAFERGRPAAATWQYGGLNPQGLRF